MILDPGHSPLRIAVVGGGVAGLTAAYILNRRHHVTIYEKNQYLGGHTHTVVIPDGPDEGTPVDTGFIVMNHRNYPLFTRLLEQLEVPLQDSSMSFSYWCEGTRFFYSGTGLNGLLAQRRNLVRPRFLSMVRDLVRFYRHASEDAASDALASATLGEYLTDRQFSRAFIDHHLVPMGSAIWSTPTRVMLDFPALAFLRFFDNHGLLTLRNRHQWRTIPGGSQTYVRAIRKTLTGDVHLGARIAGISRRPEGATVHLEEGSGQDYDAVVIGAHADQALALLRDPSPDEQRLLGAWEYEPNHTVLHTDQRLLPPRKRAWSSWNFLRSKHSSESSPVSVNYYMNQLQNLETQRPYVVSLNATAKIPDEARIMETTYLHPTFSFGSMASQRELPSLNGCRNTWFCGSYFGYGFHEDAVRSGVEVARGFGMDL